MQVIKTDLAKTGFFSDLFLDYLSKKPELTNFYDSFPEIPNFISAAKKINFSTEKREVLHRSLLNQYQGLEIKKEVRDAIDSLKKETTYTVTTGHQLNIFSGPLYFIYKIVTVVKAAKILNQQNKDLHFVPVYWMASEDHDFEEINHFHLFNKKFTWESDQKGPVGRFKTDGLEKIFAEIKEALPLFQKAYLEHKNLAAATRYFVNELFGKEGLLIIDGDDKELKQQFIPVIKDELVNHVSSELITKASNDLENLGYKLQINPRQINLFYIETGLRERIVREGSVYKVLNTGIEFSEKEIHTVVEKNPEKFSPNVALRPVYQQLILPNVAYCGGPAEVAYWLQLKSLCDHYKVSFPILLPRNFGLYINQGNYKKLQKTGIAAQELLQEDHKLKEKIIEKISGEDFRLNEDIESIEFTFERLRNKAAKVDPTLDGFVAAEKQKALKIMEGIERRLKKAEEGKNEVLINQVLNIKSRLFPEGSLQERKDNFLNFYLNDTAFIEKVENAFDPFDYKFYILMENE